MTTVEVKFVISEADAAIAVALVLILLLAVAIEDALPSYIRALSSNYTI
jgi:hypothetical protein